MRTSSYPHRILRDQPGFTLAEVLIALLLGAMLLGGIWTLIDIMGRQQHHARKSTDIGNAATVAWAQMSTDLARTGHGLISTHNWSGVHIQAGGEEGAEADTLTVFWSDGPAYPVSTQSCEDEPNSCIAVVGSVADSFSIGDLVVVAMGRLGARLYQVQSIASPRVAPCGADCATPQISCADVAQAPYIAPVVVGSALYDAIGNLIESRATPCEQSYFPDGNRCVETVVMQVVGDSLASACTLTPTPERTYTDLVLVDRSNVFGLLDPPAFSLRSGALGTPQVIVQKLGFARYWVDYTQASPTLVKQRSLETDGRFGIALPVAYEVENLRVDVQHADSGGFVRGVGIEEAMLERSLANSNFVRATDHETNPNARGYSFHISYQTIAAVRVRMRIRSPESSAEATESDVWETEFVLATPALLGGGAFRLAQP